MIAKPTGSVLILGGASDIGRAVARRYAEKGCAVILAARHSQRLEADAADLRLRWGATVRLEDFDVLDTDGHAAFLDRLGELPDVAVCIVGLLGEQAASQQEFAAARLVLESNFIGPASILGHLANRMQARGSGVIIGVSSVAGERGRASNYIYGAAKAGLTALLSGLRNRLSGCGVQVVTVKPGFVRTRMTDGMALPAILTAEPDEVARAIVKAQIKGRDVIYVRPIWRLIMLVIRLLPEAVFKRARF